MADEKLTQLQDSTAILDSDLFAMVKNMGTTPATVSRPWSAAKTAIGPGGAYFSNLPDGTMLNGKIVPSVTSNNLTLALKTTAGNDPSASEPVWIKLNGTWRTVTAALSVTKNAGTNWCNAGSSGLATKEIDYFAYMGYNATDGVVIGFSRIPNATLYSDFSATSTAETYCAISTITNAAAGDNYVVIGRFAATLSAGAGYTWTVPTFTTTNLIQRPIYETRWLTWAPVWTGSGSLTFGSVTNTIARYKVSRDVVFVQVRATGTLGGTASFALYATVPLEGVSSGSNQAVGACLIEDNGVSVFGGTWVSPGTPDLLGSVKYNLANFTNSGTGVVDFAGLYQI